MGEHIQATAPPPAPPSLGGPCGGGGAPQRGSRGGWRSGGGGRRSRSGARSAAAPGPAPPFPRLGGGGGGLGGGRKEVVGKREGEGVFKSGWGESLEPRTPCTLPHKVEDSTSFAKVGGGGRGRDIQPICATLRRAAEGPGGAPRGARRYRRTARNPPHAAAGSASAVTAASGSRSARARAVTARGPEGDGSGEGGVAPPPPHGVDAGRTWGPVSLPGKSVSKSPQGFCAAGWGVWRAEVE